MSLTYAEMMMLKSRKIKNVSRLLWEASQHSQLNEWTATFQSATVRAARPSPGWDSRRNVLFVCLWRISDKPFSACATSSLPPQLDQQKTWGKVLGGGRQNGTSRKS